MDDVGYSNYSVEGTIFHCLKKQHPNAPFDTFYNEEPLLGYAEKCPDFSPGDPVELDCDREKLKKWDDPLSSAYATDAEIAILIDQWDPSDSDSF